MKKKLLYLALLSTITFYAQTQIGADIDGEAAGDFSGHSVSLSADGSIVAIGAYENGGNGGNDYSSGHVRVYQNNSGVWTQIGADIDGEAAGDESGWSVSLSSDGSVVAIGAPYNNGNWSGHVRVYQNNSGVWTQIGADIDGEAAEDLSGQSVSLSADGSIVAIGTPYNDGNGTYSGHVRVYQNNSEVWTQIGADIDGEAGDYSGKSVSLSADGSMVAIGAIGSDGSGGNYGNAYWSGYVRVYQNNSGVWTQIGADIKGEAAEDLSGQSVSLSADGSTVAIGAPHSEITSSRSAGYVRVYQNNSGVWTQIGADIDGEAAGDRSGYSVSLSADGSMVAIGAFGNFRNENSSGYVRIYQNNSGVWTQIGVDIDGEAKYDYSGRSVSLSADGSTVAIGARYNGGNGNFSGHVRVYNLSALLSLKDNKISKSFAVFPNPVKDKIQLQLTSSLEYKKATIYNYFGQLVLQSNKLTVNVSSLSSGIYFLEIETDKGKGVKKISKE